MPPKIDLVDRFMAAFATGDRTILEQLVHPDFKNPQSSALPYGGRIYQRFEGFTEFALGIWPATWRLDRFENPHRFYERDTEPGIESVVMMLHIVGKVAATGEPLDTTLLEHWIFKDGKLFYAKPHWFEPPPNSPASPKKT